MVNSKKKLLACALAASMAIGVMPSAEAAEATGDPELMQNEIQALSARLYELEQQLQKVKDQQKKSDKNLKKGEKKQAGQIKWGGSVKTGYWSSSDGKNKVKGEWKLNGKASLPDDYMVGVGFKMKATSYEPKKQYKIYNKVLTDKNTGETQYDSNGNYLPNKKNGQLVGSDKYSQESTQLKLERAYVRKDFKNGLQVTAGIQDRQIGNGLWVDKPGINCFSADWQFTPRDIVSVAYGRDSLDKIYEDPATRTRILTYLNYQHNFTKDAYLGAYIGKQQPDHYIGIFGSTPIVGKLWASAEYIRSTNNDKPFVNDTSDATYGYWFSGSKSKPQGYLIDLNYGHAKKKGDFQATLEWINTDQNLFMTSDYSGWNDYVSEEGFKGFGLDLSYMLSNNSKLELIRYWSHNKPDSDNVWGGNTGYTMARQNLSNFYLKLTTKF